MYAWKTHISDLRHWTPYNTWKSVLLMIFILIPINFSLDIGICRYSALQSFAKRVNFGGYWLLGRQLQNWWISCLLNVFCSGTWLLCFSSSCIYICWCFAHILWVIFFLFSPCICLIFACIERELLGGGKWMGYWLRSEEAKRKARSDWHWFWKRRFYKVNAILTNKSI